MCGSVGFRNTPEVRSPESVVKAMADRIVHRGPDDADYYVDQDVSLGFRRLSIIDLEGGRQPILNEDGTKVLTFNGEIYNYQDIKKDLLAAGHVFKTATDSEVLLHGYEEYGKGILQKLRGMFAFVIWDKEKRELFGARDFFGIKPLYYAQMNGTLLFGSEIKSFLHHPHFVKELNEKALENYLSFQYSPGPETFFKNVYKMPQGHYFKYKDGKMELTRYWIPTFQAEEDKSLEYWVDEIEKTFDDSVEAHKISDVEVGSFLSSGVDSSYVACSAHVDKTFTVGFDNGTKYNEISYAQELSEQIPVKNISHIITPEEFEATCKKDGLEVRPNDWVVINTGFHHYWRVNNDKYYNYYAGEGPELARYLVSKGIKGVTGTWGATDAPLWHHPLKEQMPWLETAYVQATGKSAAEKYPDYEPCHRIYMQSGVCTVENAGGDVDEVTGKRCFFMAFPWRWRGGDGCIVRVLAITDPDGDFRFESGK